MMIFSVIFFNQGYGLVGGSADGPREPPHESGVAAETEYGMELGGQSFELGFEIHLAKQERETLQSEWPPAQAMCDQKRLRTT